PTPPAGSTASSTPINRSPPCPQFKPVGAAVERCGRTAGPPELPAPTLCITLLPPAPTLCITLLPPPPTLCITLRLPPPPTCNLQPASNRPPPFTPLPPTSTPSTANIPPSIAPFSITNSTTASPTSFTT